MGKYVKLFETHADYTAFTQTEDFILPNVSHCILENDVHYNPIPPPDTNGHEYVDLGLPSGTLWATVDVGSTNINECGLYFRWGETQGYTKEVMLSDNPPFLCKWNEESYNTDGHLDHYFETPSTLSLEDDAVRTNWGGNWVMPTESDFKELFNNTTTTFDSNNKLLRLTSSNGNYIEFSLLFGCILYNNTVNKNVQYVPYTTPTEVAHSYYHTSSTNNNEYTRVIDVFANFYRWYNTSESMELFGNYTIISEYGGIRYDATNLRGVIHR